MKAFVEGGHSYLVSSVNHKGIVRGPHETLQKFVLAGGKDVPTDEYIIKILQDRKDLNAANLAKDV